MLVAGQVRKWAGRPLDVDLPALRAEAAASRDRILRAAAGERGEPGQTKKALIPSTSDR
ncbi:hypothetical protein [Kitasatospora sp. NPDC085879]|uniref:hypothetical protein n=1 Tax=Kitasatospora sp. NPDC085879 TaxID=3154769 RepID=UPI00342F89EB